MRRFRSASIFAPSLCVLFVAFSMLATFTTLAGQPLVTERSVWSYLDDGTELPATWVATEDADGWRQGAGQLGFGGDRCAGGTLVRDVGATFYFRHEFQLPLSRLETIQGLRLRLRRNDDVAVFLNGHEVYRLAMAGRSPETRQPYFDTWFVDPSALVSGVNVLAAEVRSLDPLDRRLCFDLELAALTDEVELWRGPYLQQGTADGVTLRFLTSIPASPTVRFGPTPSALLRAQSGPRGTDHAIALEGLAAGSRYYYSIEVDDVVLAGADRDHWFRTHPTPGTESPVRIWVVGDTGTGQFSGSETVFDSYREATGAEPTDVWLMLGDNAYPSGTEQEHHDAVFQVYPELLRNTSVWPTIGNHDRRSFTDRGTGPYFDVFTLPTRGESGGIASGTENYYSFDYGHVHFIVLDSGAISVDPGGPQLEWLVRDLEATEADWIIVSTHIPPYSKGSHDSDYIVRHQRIREQVLPILEEHGVDLMLAGHSHGYERSYMIRGHYLASSDFDRGEHIVDGRNGCPDDERATECAGAAHGAYTADGSVYAVVGNSSHTVPTGSLDHPAMLVGTHEKTGSMIIEIDGDRLEARFLESDGNIADRFVIVRSDEAADPVVYVAGISLSLGGALAAAGLRRRRKVRGKRRRSWWHGLGPGRFDGGPTALDQPVP